MRETNELEVGDQAIAKQPDSPTFTSLRLFPTDQSDEMGFGATVKDRVSVSLGLSVENSLEAVFDEALSQQLNGMPAHAHGFDNFLVGPATMCVKKSLCPFPLLGRMLPFVQKVFKLSHFIVCKSDSVNFLHGILRGKLNT